MEAEAPSSARFRRAGLLSRLRRRSQEEAERYSVESLSADGPPHEPAVDARSLVETQRPLGPAPRAAYLITPERPGPAVEGGFSALAARRDQFLRQWHEDADLNMIRFREGERLPAKTASALKYRIADHLQKLLEVESILGQAAPFVNPISGRGTRDREEVERAARDVRAGWDLGAGPIVNLLGLLEDKGVRVYEARGLEGFEGLSGQFGPVPFIAVGVDNPADRIRFTAAHELGHILCDFGGKSDPEGECHAFGAAFLLPRPALEKFLRPARRKVTLGDLAEIKEAFGISLQAIMYRAHGLGFISDRQLRAFRETFKERGWLVEEPVVYTGRERAMRFRRLLRYAVAADILDKNRAADLAGMALKDFEREFGEIF